ncbi:MAG: tryptophan synthase subunit alpha [Deltaproteobacteria bacterium]|nr:tryptophan synthase subunit alpha [Deltaproteobacteria bacterium]
MSRLDACFAGLRERGECALIPFVTAGDPDMQTTAQLVPALAEAGADVIEIGVPFSDPMAEGPTIQRSSERALAGGATLRRVFEMIADLRAHVATPIVLMGYANVFLCNGEASFAEAAAAAGVDGVICVDLPPEEGESYRAALAAAGVDSILLASPTTSSERLAMLAEQTRGFLYYVSLTGVTGARSELAAGIEAPVRRAREDHGVPVCVGFGVSKPEHAARIAAFADGVVVGSALVERVAAAPSRDTAVDAAVRFVAELKEALRPR